MSLLSSYFLYYGKGFIKIFGVKPMLQRYKNENGFTLMEMIIVIIIMGVLAAVIIPQIGSTTYDAKVNTLKTDLTAMRKAVELYYAHHNGRYPGATDDEGDVNADVSKAVSAFVPQLTLYTDVNGKTSDIKTATAKYGPYIKGDKLPENPFNNSRDVVCDTTTTDITVRTWDGVGTAGWHFYTQTGNLVANDSAAHAAL